MGNTNRVIRNIPYRSQIMANPNVPTHAPIKPSPKGEQAVDPTTQTLTVGIALETTADQLGVIIAGLGSFIPPNVSNLSVEVGVGTSTSAARDRTD